MGRWLKGWKALAKCPLAKRSSMLEGGVKGRTLYTERALAPSGSRISSSSEGEDECT